MNWELIDEFRIEGMSHNLKMAKRISDDELLSEIEFQIEIYGIADVAKAIALL